MAQVETVRQRRQPAVAQPWTGILLAAVIAGIIGAAWRLPPGANWAVTALAMCIFLAVIGRASVGRWAGILINERKLMSLSRFQMTFWTVIVISAYFTIAMARIKAGDVAEPLAIQADPTLWALLGISAASLIGTPLLYSGKKYKKPENDNVVIKRAAEAFRESERKVRENQEGLLWGNPSAEDARITDMFEGDELANAACIDVAKVQMFFFTLLVGVAYCFDLYEMLTYDDLLGDVALPPLSEGLLALMGVSHAGYLGSKGIDYTTPAREPVKEE